MTDHAIAVRNTLGLLFEISVTKALTNQQSSECMRAISNESILMKDAWHLIQRSKAGM